MKDSLTYLSIIDYIKRNGREAFIKLFEELDKENINSLSCEDYLFGSDKTRKIDDIIRKNIDIIKFLRNISNGNIDFLNNDFRKFILNLDSKDKIDLYFNNAKELLNLQVDRIFINARVCDTNIMCLIGYNDKEKIGKYNNIKGKTLYFKTGEVIFNRTMYTDGETELHEVPKFIGKGTIENPYRLDDTKKELYFVRLKNSNFILMKSDCSGKTYRTFSQNGYGFDFDVNKLPSKEELMTYNEPEYIKEYKKTLG